MFGISAKSQQHFSLSKICALVQYANPKTLIASLEQVTASSEDFTSHQMKQICCWPKKTSCSADDGLVAQVIDVVFAQLESR